MLTESFRARVRYSWMNRVETNKLLEVVPCLHTRSWLSHPLTARTCRIFLPPTACSGPPRARFSPLTASPACSRSPPKVVAVDSPVVVSGASKAPPGARRNARRRRCSTPRPAHPVRVSEPRHAPPASSSSRTMPKRHKRTRKGDTKKTQRLSYCCGYVATPAGFKNEHRE